jgi:hypothetical protein
MIRKFNYTGRLRIERAKITVRVARGQDGTPRSFDCSFDLGDTGLPEGVRIYVEAYYRSWYRRFPFGTVGKPEKPMVTDLTDAGVQYMLFRVKAVDKSGKILAEADNIWPEDLEPSDANRRCILPINYTNLGERLWNIYYECGQTPALEVNDHILRIGLQVKEIVTTPRFAPLVFPAALSELLRRISDCGASDGDDSPESLWLQFVGKFYNAPMPNNQNAEEIAAWIKGAVEAFSDIHRFASQFGGFFGEQPPND